ncbi:unnamed protein product [marine sediment metagenome]|uniref:Endonuclease NucS C-terminal domain-containing protein n=1 Tax=marine sediment metagenome TaxID=412755 RepID=X1HQJ9_9ZZZZ
MPIEQLIWKVGTTPIKLSGSSLTSENELEDMICKDISILNEEWLPIGRQVLTEHGGQIDILAINENGNLIISWFRDIHRCKSTGVKRETIF